MIKISLTHSSPSPIESLPQSPLPQRGREPSVATGLSLAEDSGGKYTHQGAQEIPVTTAAGV